MLFTTKHEQNMLFLVNSKTEFLSLALQKGKETLVLSLFFVSSEEKDCYCLVSVGQLGLTVARTTGPVEVNQFFAVLF